MSDVVRGSQDLMGVSELADRLGVSRQRAQQLTRGENFPQPLARLHQGPVWRTADVNRWIHEHRPGD
jgi:prophage regulatory protein